MRGNSQKCTGSAIIGKVKVQRSCNIRAVIQHA